MILRLLDLPFAGFQMVDKVESIIESMDRRVCERLDRIEDRLNWLEGSSVPSPIAVEMVSFYCIH